MTQGSGPIDLEEAFFAEDNARLLEKLRKEAKQEERREMLRKVVRIQDAAFLDRLIAMGIGPERAMVLRLIPLIFVAWADGAIDERERKAIMDAATQHGLAAEEIAQQALGDWLERKPERRLLQMWKDYIGEVWDRFTPDEQLQMRGNLISSTRQVAEAAGGFLGIATISAAEQAVLDELEQVVS
jgi:hypothetical protein